MSHGRHRNKPRGRNVEGAECEQDWQALRDADLAERANGYCEPAPGSRADRQAETIRNLMADLAAETARADAAETILAHRTPRWLFWLRMIGWTLLCLGWGYLARVLTE